MQRVAWMFVGAATVAAAAGLAWAQARVGTLRVEVIERECRGCGNPVDVLGRPVARAYVELARGRLDGRTVARGRSNARGVVTFRVPAGRYCLRWGGAPADEDGSRASRCTLVAPGRAVSMRADVSRCPPLNCPGNAP